MDVFVIYSSVPNFFVPFQISEEEISFLTNGEDPYDDAVVRKLFHPNLKLLLVTEGADGCRYYTKVCIPKMLFSKMIYMSYYTKVCITHINRMNIFFW